ncbi:hypothetical protein WJX74_003929 [Apatococcus lobatus]
MADSVAPVLRPVYDELSSIVTALKTLSGQSSCDEDLVLKLQRQLHDIDERFEDGKFEDAEHNVPAGQAVLSDLLSEAHELVEACYEKFPDEETESP